MIEALPSAKYELIREMTACDDNQLNIVWLCEIAGVSRSGYYRWFAAEPERQRREEQDRADFELILEAYLFRGYAKGGRGIHMRLLHLETPVVMNLKKIYRLKNKYNLRCPIRSANPYRRMAKALRTSNVADNIVNREFEEHGARAVLLTDITYIRRGDGEFSYLSAVKDAGSKEILAWVASASLEVDFVLQTVEQLIAKHGTELKTNTLLHSDQGCHYTSYAFIDLLKSKQLRQSMSRKANCWDNAPQESFFGHMKDELSFAQCVTHEDVVRVLEDWMDYYNNDRYQWELAKLSPAEYYKYVTMGVYPLPIPPPKNAIVPLGGSAPKPPEFIALVSGEGAGKEKDDTS
jgi:transposase InsO family protein